MKILISQYKLKVPYYKYLEAARQDAPLFNEIGIEWRIWLVNKEEGLVAGIHYYEDQEALDRGLKQLRSKGRAPREGMIENISKQVFEVNEDLSKINKAPL